MIRSLSLTASLLIFGLGALAQVQSTIEILPGDTHEEIIQKAARVVPTDNQYEAQKREYIGFIHFGINTFTRKEWGNGIENPQTFDLKTLDTDQWVETMKNTGMKMVIITVKHHDGFVLWQSRYTKHGVMSSPFLNGKGDILKSLSASCKKYGLKLGVYLSPADLYQMESPEGVYGNESKYTERTIPREVPGRPFANKTRFKFNLDDYNEYFMNQLFELLTEYGEISEVWFDGAHPKTKGGQKYNYIAWKQLIQTLAPKAVIFGKQDLRWVGNEGGESRDPEWNVIPFTFNPDTANYFPDLTPYDLGSRLQLYKGKFLHYQPAEMDTSIREGWFYSDDTEQKVRTADDVFDIYERSVGGNSILLLNIPPNREGRFSDRDVESLEEVGRRLRATYTTSLFNKAKGPKKILDNNPNTYEVLNSGKIEISTPKPVTINRFVIQEAIKTHGERVEEHTLEAWVNNQWKLIATGKNIGYKRILRFPDITASKFRFTATKIRLTPAISNISAHYYKSTPPQLEVMAQRDGSIKIEPARSSFKWNVGKENPLENINSGMEIRYTSDGSEPTKNSKLYSQPFKMEKGEIKAASFLNDQKGNVITENLAIVKKDWQVEETSSELRRNRAENAIDANRNSYWSSDSTGAEQYITLDLGKVYEVKAFAYTPQTHSSLGMLEKGEIWTSTDKRNWLKVADVEFGNLINDPTRRKVNFTQTVKGRYFKIKSKQIAGGGKMLTIGEVDFYEL